MKLISLFVRPDITVINDPDERQRRIQDELDDLTGRKSENLFDGCYEGVGRPKIYTGLEAQMRRESLRDRPHRTRFWHGDNFTSGGGVPA
jgi:hypothetical protein